MTVTTEENKEYILKIGSKGEIFPPKEVREKLGFKKGETIILSIHRGKMLVRVVKSLDELLDEPAKKTISYHAWKKFRSNLSVDAEK